LQIDVETLRRNSCLINYTLSVIKEDLLA